MIIDVTRVAQPAAEPIDTLVEDLKLGIAKAGPKGLKGDLGNAGWSPLLAVVLDGDRSVFQVADWIGGEGAKPATGAYVGDDGFVVDIADATNVRGLQGLQGIQGIQGIQGVQGNKGWSAVFAIVSDGARRVYQIADWQGGEGTKPASGKYVGAAGLVDAVADAVDVRGTQGIQGNTGAAATVSVGSVTTGAAGSPASVVNSGTSSAAVLDFTIPQGLPGTGTVTSVGLTVPTGLSVTPASITTSGTFAITYASGYQGYTTTEATKLSGITAGADPTGTTINAATTKTTPVDADTMPLIDSAASNALKKVTWANVKATLKTYFDTLYQAASAKLTALAGQTWAADQITYQTGASTLSTTALTAFGRSLIDDANAAAARTTLGLAIGTDVQAYDADLSTIAALAPAEGDVLTYSGGVWTAAPASGGDMGLPGAMTKDPRLLPCYDGTSLSAVYVLGTNTTPDSSEFWTEIGRVGAFATTSTDNTYTQICDITGSGVLFHVISQAITNTTDDVTFRITVDGTVYTIAKTQTWAASGAVNGRVILGVCADYNQIGSKYTTSLNWLYDMAGGGQSTQAFRKGSARATPIPPSEIMNNAMPCVRFDTGLKVEVKVTDVFPTGNGPYCGATYILD